MPRAAAGAKEAGYVLLRLPLEVRDLFREWVMENFPDRSSPRLQADPRHARRQGLRSKWGERMTGTGPIAWMIGRRFEAACERLGLNRQAQAHHRTLRADAQVAQQLDLF